jgi:hypothetical protein
MKGEILATHGEWSVIDWTGPYVMLHRAGDDLNEPEALVMDEATWYWLNVCAAPLAVATLRRPPGRESSDPRPAAAREPEATGGVASNADDATDPEDGQLLLSEVVDAPPPPPPRRRRRT